MNKLGSYLCVIVLSAVGMMLGHWLGTHLEGTTVSVEAQPASEVSVVSTRTLEVVGANGRRQIVMGTSAEGSPTVVVQPSIPVSVTVYGRWELIAKQP